MRLTKKKALDISIELWGWMAETGSYNKWDWPEWEKYGEMKSTCPLYEYYLRRKHGGCRSCPLNYCTDDPAFRGWLDATTTKCNKKFAGLFLEQLKEKREATK